MRSPSSTDATDGTARPPADRALAQAAGSALRNRIISALVMAPLALFAVWQGGLVFAAVLVVAAWLMSREWARLVGAGGGGDLPALLLSAAAVLPMVLLAIEPWHGPMLLAAVAGAGLLLLFARLRGLQAPVTYAAGLLVILVPCVALAWLREGAPQGRALVFWVLAIVWATDIGAFVVGRTVGGPRLAPRVSPNKTWSGLIGGMVSAGIAGGLVAQWVEGAGTAVAAVLSMGMAVVAQLGDLAESGVKRRFGVKDTGGLIPGHGGLLDRVDGLLTAAPAFALLMIVAGSRIGVG